MKIVCQGCGKKIDASNHFCTFCGSENSISEGEMMELWKKNRKKRTGRILITIASVIVSLVLIVVILDKNLMLPTQYQARMNRKAVKAYVAEYYPDAVLVREKFNTIENHSFLAVPSVDLFVYNKNGVEFNILAQFAGSSVCDDYVKKSSLKDPNEILWYGYFVQEGYHKDDIPSVNFTPYPDGEYQIDVYIENDSDEFTREFEWELRDFVGYLYVFFPEQSGIERFYCKMTVNMNGRIYWVNFNNWGDYDPYTFDRIMERLKES